MNRALPATGARRRGGPRKPVAGGAVLTMGVQRDGRFLRLTIARSGGGGRTLGYSTIVVLCRSNAEVLRRIAGELL